MRHEQTAAGEFVIIQKLCDNLALHMLSLIDTGDWPGWIQYLLEKLDGMAGNSEPPEIPGDLDFAWVLEQLRDGIDVRIKQGEW